MSQIALPLSQPGKSDRIVVGSANMAIIEALRDPSGWPFRTAILRGPARSGKSLLGQWFSAQASCETLDDADTMDETQLFHRWNAAQESGTALLLIASDEKWQVELPDLRSRLGAALDLRIGPLDDAMVGELIEYHAERRGLAMGEGAASYLVPRCIRDFAAVERLVEEIDRLSLERKHPPTMSIWRDALEELFGGDQQQPLI